MLRFASYSVASVAVVATLALMAHEGGSIASLLSGFSIWAIAPYALFATAAAVARIPGTLIAAFAVELLAVGFAAFVYFDAFFVHLHSTSALVFIFVPLYQLIAAAVLVVLAATLDPHAAKTI